MSVTQQIEASVDAMIGKLTAGLPAKVAEINGEIGDEWLLAEPEGITFGQRSETPYPWVAVLPVRTVKVADASGMIIKKHLIDVVPWIECWQEDGIARMVSRYLRAVDEVALAKRQPGQALEEGGYGVEFIEDYYGPVFGEPGKAEVTSWGRARYAVRQEQYIG